MRGITVHLNDVVEERDRRQKRRAAGYMVVVALAAFAAGLQFRRPVEVRETRDFRLVVKAPAVTWPEIGAIVVDRAERGAHRAGAVDRLTTSHTLTDLPIDSDLFATEPHLCVSPSTIVLKRAESGKVTISNPGNGAVAITDVSTESGYRVDRSGCPQFLWPGRHCTMTVVRDANAGQTAQLAVYSDAGEPVSLTVKPVG